MWRQARNKRHELKGNLKGVEPFVWKGTTLRLSIRDEPGSKDDATRKPSEFHRRRRPIPDHES